MDRSVRQSMDPVRGEVHGPGVSVFGSPLTIQWQKRTSQLWKVIAPNLKKMKQLSLSTVESHFEEQFLSLQVSSNLHTFQRGGTLQQEEHFFYWNGDRFSLYSHVS